MQRFFILPAILLIVFASNAAMAQQTDEGSDSLFAVRLMEDNLVLYQQVDSLNHVIANLHSDIIRQNQIIDSLGVVTAGIPAELVTSTIRVDTLVAEKLQLTKELLSRNEKVTGLSKQLEQALKDLRDNEIRLTECKNALKEAESKAALRETQLEGKTEVISTKVEGKDREIALLQKAIDEKDALIKEKSAELNACQQVKANSIKIIDSLSRTLNEKNLELVRVNERLKIIESQYNELVAQRAAATNKKKKIRFVQGVALKNYRTPDWQLAPLSSSSTSVYAITNKNSGKMEFDYMTGISLSLYDLTQDNGKFTYDAGLFVGFGGANLFKNFYIAPSFKAFDYFHFMLGCNIAEYQQLQKGFSEGDVLAGGMSIPTVKEWKANFFFGMTIDFELLTSIPKKM